MDASVRELSYSQAIQEAMAIALESDPRVFLMGEDIGVYGGAFQVTGDLVERFGADRVIVTSDNPRSEEPSDIAQQIMSGIGDAVGRSHVSVELDRRSAIELALMTARKGDVVIIAGKGHEATQTIGADETPFSDVEVSRELLKVAS